MRRSRASPIKSADFVGTQIEKKETVMQRTLLTVICFALFGCSKSPEPDSASTMPPATKTTSEAALSTETDAGTDGLYTVDSYDATRDASADFATTISRAQTEQKRIILEIGGDW